MRVLTQVQHQVLTMPAGALERGPDGLFTYLVNADSTIAVAPVTIGEQNNETVVVQNGLKAGDKVVASNQYRLQPGSHIRANAPRNSKGSASKPAEQAP
jgi:multidrug efflux system membrane fusion protein